jgi:RNA polymerase sigma factor (TIGR02999 family)
MNDITSVIDIGRDATSAPPEELFPAVYEELRRMAAQKMAGENGTQTLQATALVHEVWLRLGAGGGPGFQNRGYFFAAAAEAMRRILVERARAKWALKRGGKGNRVSLDELDEEPAAVEDKDEMLLQVHEALEALAKEDPREAEVVKLRFFAGMTHPEIAAILEVNEKTVRRYWNHAKAWLYVRIQNES